MLHHTQSAFKEALFGNKTALVSSVLGTQELSCEDRIGIYQYAYVSRLVDALKEDYPVVLHQLGETEFSALAQAYVATHPSQHYSLRELGRKLPLFLAHSTGVEKQPYLAELARIEWSVVDAFDAANLSVISVEEMQTIAPEHWPSLVFQFHPSMQRVTCEWNSMEVWSEKREHDTSLTFQRLDKLHMWLIWRQYLTIHYRPLSTTEATILEHAIKGHSFAELCEIFAQTCASDTEAVPAIASILHGWIQGGLILNQK